MDRRADIRGPADYLYTMRVARKRFAEDKRSGLAGTTAFRAWARRTYAERACTGKLRALVA